MQKAIELLQGLTTKNVESLPKGINQDNYLKV